MKEVYQKIFLLILINSCVISGYTSVAVGIQHQSQGAIESVNQFTNFSTYFYISNEIDLVSSSINFLDSSNILDITSLSSSIAAFYSEIFKSNPDKLPEWINKIDSLSDPNIKKVFWLALWMSNNSISNEYLTNKINDLKGEEKQLLLNLLNTEPLNLIAITIPNTPEENDMLWAAFFASGDPIYVKNIINVAVISKKHDDLIEFSTSLTAKWSLASNAQKHKAVKKILRNERNERTGKEKEVINDILQKSLSANGPQEIYSDGLIEVENIKLEQWLKKFNKLEKPLLINRKKSEDKILDEKTSEILLKKIVNSIESIKSYRSVLIVRDFTCKDLESKNFEIIKWNFESSYSDKMHIYQSTWLEDYPNGGVDEWISINGKLIGKLGPWRFNIDQELFDLRIQLNQFLKFDKYLPYLTGRKPMIVKMDNYYLLKYSLEGDHLIGPWKIKDIRKELVQALWHVFAKIDGEQIQFLHLPVTTNKEPERSIIKYHDSTFKIDIRKSHLFLFINPDTINIEKVSIELLGQLQNNNEEIFINIEQYWGDVNSEIIIEEPEEFIGKEKSYVQKSCEDDCTEMLKKGELKEGMDLESCIKALCGN